MRDIKGFWCKIVLDAVKEMGERRGVTINLTPESVIVERPPKPEMGDIAFPMFQFAKFLKMPPVRIASGVLEGVRKREETGKYGDIRADGPYLNVRINRALLTDDVISGVLSDTAEYVSPASLTGKRIMVEFSCPNTNKPLHLGHLRNDAIGESVSRILEFCGAEIMKVNLINDRGIHICKSMAAYREFANGSTPEDEGLKGDHFVGKYYVRFNEWAKESDDAEKIARDMLKKWEAGDGEILALWKKMNEWAISGIKETYERTGVSFDKIYYESETYKLGKSEVLRGLEEGIFYREDDGSVWIDLREEGLDRKVLLRSDGTSLYLTQDIGTAVQRYKDWPFDRLIYVVASEQNYHFRVLFIVLRRLGYEWADNLYHLAYGMVHLPEGKMKSREGKVVDADDLIEELKQLAMREIKEKGREGEVDNIEDTSEKIALGALNYYLLQVHPVKDIVFNPEESISFTGNTGPYIQYTGARISSMLRKFEERKKDYEGGVVRVELLNSEIEWEIVKGLSGFKEVVAKAAKEFNPSLVADYLFDLCKNYSRYYHDYPVLHNKNRDVVISRIELARAVLEVLKVGMYLLGIPFLEKM